MHDNLIDHGWAELAKMLQEFKDKWIREAAYYKWLHDNLIDHGWAELAKMLQEFKDKWIREAAYYKWLAAGSPPGDGKEFWLSAEQDYIAEASKPVKTFALADGVVFTLNDKKVDKLPEPVKGR